MARLGTNRLQTSLANLAPSFFLEKRFGGTVNPYRLVKIASDGDIEQAGANSSDVIGVYNGSEAAASGEALATHQAIAWGPAVVEADAAITLPARLKAAAAGRVVPLVDAARSGDEIDAIAAGGNFGNQPANDGVEIVSNNAGDVQAATVYFTTNGDGDTVSKETVTLTGTTPVALTATDVQLVLGVELASVAVGTVTIREASGDATITTITAGNTTAGVQAVPAADQNAYNVAPTAVAGGASTKQIGLVGTDADGAEELDSQALNGTTAVTFNVPFRTVTKILFGDIATATTATVNVGAEDDENLCIGKALEAASAQGDKIDAFVLPR